jgi:hypothetical protein
MTQVTNLATDIGVFQMEKKDKKPQTMSELHPRHLAAFSNLFKVTQTEFKQ